MDGEPTIDPEATRDVIDHGRLGHGRVGIIDVGSNSIRLVVYERASRAPLPVFNEKVLCGLARGLDATGRLNPRRRNGARPTSTASPRSPTT
jgi:exopolyphosphatase/guanosine-5'-triphosphate,3'-diphosphate pyrophosphatase